MNTRWKLAAVLGCALLSTLLGSRASLADAPSPPPGEPGMWQKHEYSFTFLGFTSTYSCDGLADKLRVLLIASGARPDAKARAGACASGFGRPDKFARADLTFYTLAPWLTAAAPGAPPINGVWQPVSLADRSPRELSRGIANWWTSSAPRYSRCLPRKTSTIAPPVCRTSSPEPSSI